MNGEERQEKKQRGIPSPFTVIRLVRFGVSAVRAVGAVGALFANPASAVIIAIVILVILALFILLFPGAGGLPLPGEGEFPVPTLPAGKIASCPVPGGIISTHSYSSDPLNGHCGQTYQPSCNSESRRAKSIDVPTNSGDVVLPTIKDQVSQWQFTQQFPINITDCERQAADGTCGIGLSFQANLALNNRWTLHFIHLEADSANSFFPGAQYAAGTPVGKSAIGHVHITIGRNVTNQFAQIDSGWIPAEDLGMCSGD